MRRARIDTSHIVDDGTHDHRAARADIALSYDAAPHATLHAAGAHHHAAYKTPRIDASGDATR